MMYWRQLTLDDLRTVTLEWDKAAGKFKFKYPLLFYRTYDEGAAVFAFDAKTLKYIAVDAADDLSDCRRFALYQPEFDTERFIRIFGANIPQFVDTLNEDITYMLLEPVIGVLVCTEMSQEFAEEQLANGEMPWLK